MAIALPLGQRIPALFRPVLRPRATTTAPRIVAPVTAPTRITAPTTVRTMVPLFGRPSIAPTPRLGDYVARPQVLPMLTPQPTVVESATAREQFIADKAATEAATAVPRCNTCTPVLRAETQPISTTPAGAPPSAAPGAGASTAADKAPSAPAGGLSKEVAVGLVVALAMFVLIGR